jgi:acyl-CoA reductase-like NAD-dependent aldehyde dehydrogenase
MNEQVKQTAESGALFPMTIGGKAVMTGSSFAVTNPATGEIVGYAPEARASELDAAVAAAAEAFKSWSTTDDATRAAACHAIADRIEAHGEELARLITLEQGKPLGGIGSMFEVQGAVGWGRYTAGLSLKAELLTSGEGGNVEKVRKPLGVVGSITPWNWPMLIAVWHILPAVRSGCTVVSKPSPYTPLSTLRLVALMNEVLPAGVVNIVTGNDSTTNIGALMSVHKGIRKIVFTGSTPTGQNIMRSAADTLKRLTLELGGNDAGIVLPDVDPQAIAEGLFWSAFINAGQTCAALKRLYVHEAVYDAVCEALTAYVAKVRVGNGLEDGTVLGPVSNKMQFDKVVALVESAKVRGRVLIGGTPSEGLFYPPTLIADLENGDPLVDQEQFGPVLPIIKFRDIDEVIAAANANPAGLGGSVWSADPAKARAIASRLECGTVWINQHGMIRPDAPFGGTKMSGLGVQFAQDGMHEYTDLQIVIS